MNNVQPRQLVLVDSTAILEWQRMLYRDYGNKKGLLRHPDIAATRGALHLGQIVSVSVSGRTHTANLGVNYYAKKVGYAGGGANLHGQLVHLLNLGFLTKHGTGGKGGRAPILSLSVPCVLIPELAGVRNNGFLALLDSLRPEIVTVANTAEPAVTVDPGPDAIGAETSTPELTDYGTQAEPCPVGTYAPNGRYMPSFAQESG